MLEKRKVRFQGKEFGSVFIDDLYRMASRGQIDRTAEFWSVKDKTWHPLTGILFDFSPFQPRLRGIKSAGLSKVKILGGGLDDCPACKALHGQVYAIEDVPILPPPNCTCVPWCRCVAVGAR
jgi:hypothetical protein